MYIDLFEIELCTKMYIELIEEPTIRRTSVLTDRQVEEWKKNGIFSGARKTIERRIGFEPKRKPKIKPEETDLAHRFARIIRANDHPALVLTMRENQPFPYGLSRVAYTSGVVITARTLNSRERRKGSRSKGRA